MVNLNQTSFAPRRSLEVVNTGGFLVNNPEAELSSRGDSVTPSPMANRYILNSDDDGSFSIIDIFTGWNARHVGRELTRIPAHMAQSGLALMNALDAAERLEHSRAVETSRSPS